MSAENVELVRTLQPAEADLVEVMADAPDVSAEYEVNDPRFADDFHVEFISATPGVMRPSYEGLAGFVAGWREWLEPYASYWMTTEEFIDAGDRVLVLVKVQAKTARDGVKVEHSPAAVWTVADGKAAAVRLYLDRDTAFAEAGLPRDAKPVQEPRR
jgi:ketosteroid isomerase-like protein